MDIELLGEDDYLSNATDAKKRGISAAKAVGFSEAWKQFNLQKQAYLQNANKCGFTASQVLALGGTVHEQLADVLRREGKHKQALIDIVYWVATSSRVKKSHDKKLAVYFNRAKLSGKKLSDVIQFISELNNKIDYRRIQEYVLY